MSRQQRIKSNSGYYHVMLRGNEKKDIFHEDEDKQRLLEIILCKKQEDKFYLHAFCLMDNHIHLLISEGKEDIAKAIKRIAVSYVSFFNKKYKRVGHLFQDRFKSEIVENDSYAISLARYIHQNPVKAKMVRRPSEYKWSSYNSYLEENDDSSQVLDREILMGMFSNDKEKARLLFIEYMNEINQDDHLDIKCMQESMDEKEAKQLLDRLIKQRGVTQETGKKTKIPDDLILEFKYLTNLSNRRIASIADISKDKINKILNKMSQ